MFLFDFFYIFVVFKANLKDIIKSNSHTSISFVVIDVYRTPDKSIEPGEIFNIDADLSVCPCTPSTLVNASYIITGKLDENRKLNIDGDLIKV